MIVDAQGFQTNFLWQIILEILLVKCDMAIRVGRVQNMIRLESEDQTEHMKIIGVEGFQGRTVLTRTILVKIALIVIGTIHETSVAETKGKTS